MQNLREFIALVEEESNGNLGKKALEENLY